MDKANSGVFKNCNNHIRKKLVELFDEAARICNNQDCRACGYFREENCINKTIIDHLLANGVTVQECGKPLTLEELRQMEGKPVWVDHWRGGEWVIVHWDYARRMANTYEASLHEHEYGETWMAYRYKPSQPPKKEE